MTQRFFGQIISPEIIQQYFYNKLIEVVLERGNVTKENIEQKILDGIISMIREVVENSKNQEGIRLSNDIIITPQNCPLQYKTFLDILLSLKTNEPTHHQLNAIAKELSQLDSFKTLNPTTFLLEAMGVNQATRPISLEMIRESFYNEMVIQTFVALDKNLITLDNILNQDSTIYIALPALTILEAIKQSSNQSGIHLLNGVLTKENCPQVEHFPMLTDLILSVKDKVQHLFDAELQVIHYKLFDKDLPPHLNELHTSELMKTMSVIQNMAIEISRKKVFHTMIEKVLTLCCESLAPINTPKTSNKM